MGASACRQWQRGPSITALMGAFRAYLDVTLSHMLLHRSWLSDVQYSAKHVDLIHLPNHMSLQPIHHLCVTLC